MLLQTVKITMGGEVEVKGGFMSHRHPWPHVMVGRPHWAMRQQNMQLYKRIAIGKNFAKLIETSVPCPKEGDGYTLGVCSQCGVKVTEESRTKVTEHRGEGESKIETWKWVASHNQIKEYGEISAGTFVMAPKNVLLLVEERDADRKGRIGMLIHAEEGYRGRSSIKLETPNASDVIKQIHDGWIGEKWVGQYQSKGDKKVDISRLGRCQERLAILQPGDKVDVTRTGKLMGQPARLVFEVVNEKHDDGSEVLTLKKIKAEGKTEEDLRPKAIWV